MRTVEMMHGNRLTLGAAFLIAEKHPFEDRTQFRRSGENMSRCHKRVTLRHAHFSSARVSAGLSGNIKRSPRPNDSGVEALLGLQRTHGNAYVQRLVQRMAGHGKNLVLRAPPSTASGCWSLRVKCYYHCTKSHLWRIPPDTYGFMKCKRGCCDWAFNRCQKDGSWPCIFPGM
jgi:hypothetical protein